VSAHPRTQSGNAYSRRPGFVCGWGSDICGDRVIRVKSVPLGDIRLEQPLFSAQFVLVSVNLDG